MNNKDITKIGDKTYQIKVNDKKEYVVKANSKKEAYKTVKSMIGI